MTKLRITCQYYENYSETGTYWKPKGGQEFEVEIGFETLMYGEPEMKEVVAEMIAEKNNSHVRYEILSIEPIFHDVEVLDANVLAQRTSKKIEAQRLANEALTSNERYGLYED